MWKGLNPGYPQTHITNIYNNSSANELTEHHDGIRDNWEYTKLIWYFSKTNKNNLRRVLVRDVSTCLNTQHVGTSTNTRNGKSFNNLKGKIQISVREDTLTCDTQERKPFEYITSALFRRCTIAS